MKKRIDAYLPRAIELIKEVGIARDGIVSNEFNGYFPSFGAAIIQSGLRPALAFYSNESSNIAGKRAKILIAIYKLVVDDTATVDISADRLLKYVLKPEVNEKAIRNKIIDASIALKLAVRTYKLDKNEHI